MNDTIIVELSKLKRNPDPVEMAELVAAFLRATGEPADRFARAIERFLPKQQEAVNV